MRNADKPVAGHSSARELESRLDQGTPGRQRGTQCLRWGTLQIWNHLTADERVNTCTPTQTSWVAQDMSQATLGLSFLVCQMEIPVPTWQSHCDECRQQIQTNQPGADAQKAAALASKGFLPQLQSH